jgi:hypothetical protein
MDNKVRERVWEIAKAMSIINKQGGSSMQRDLKMDHCVTPISNLEPEMPLWKCYIAGRTNLDRSKPKPAPDKYLEVDLCRGKHRFEQTMTKKRNLVQDCM